MQYWKSVAFGAIDWYLKTTFPTVSLHICTLGQFVIFYDITDFERCDFLHYLNLDFS